MHERLSYLFERWLSGETTAAEQEELAALAMEPSNHEDVQQLVDRSWNQTGEEFDIGEDRAREILFEIAGTQRKRNQGLVIRIRRITVAASIVACVAIGGYFVFWHHPINSSGVAMHDVKAPDRNRATITLSNGQKIFLDSAANGVLAKQNNTAIMKSEDGRIAYNADNKLNNAPNVTVALNTLTNPRGSKVIDITLSDGSRIWLNAASSITYPSSFMGDREVTLTGEAYFAVAHDTRHPFRVKVGSEIVEDIGTEFNINAYKDEPAMQTTLVQGAVKITVDKENKMLKPGQQAAVNSNRAIAVSDAVDLDQVTAWKNGYFYFKSSDIQSIMRQVSRWYDVDVQYEGAIPAGHYNGKPPRNIGAAEMLKVVEYSGVKIKIEGKKITVLQ